MPVDIYYIPSEDSPPVSIEQARRSFEAAGIPCAIEPDPDTSDMQWMIFEPQSPSTICASVKEGHIVFATVEASFHDDPAFMEKLDGVLQAMGFSAGDPNQY